MQGTIVAATAMWPAGTKVHFVWSNDSGKGMTGAIDRWLADGFVLSSRNWGGEPVLVVVPWRSVLYMRGAE